MSIVSLQIMSVLAFAYFMGSIPASLLLTKFHNMPDPRSYGSRNIGATNVGRKKVSIGIAVFLLDASKVYLAMTFAKYIQIHPSFYPMVWSCTILGQTRSMFLKLKGGKGVSCFIAGIALLHPSWFIPLSIPGFSIWLLSSRVWYASVSIVVLFLAFSINLPLYSLLINAAITTWIICMHAGNFQYQKKQKERELPVSDPVL